MPKYRMTVDMSVLESLGINLYSNAAAVLSELVANAHDADASRVSIKWETGKRVVVTDDGAGMTAADMNDRFLKVGYQKRDNEGTESPKWGRKYMGRKGIGKLSVFSIADKVTVYSTKDGSSNGFQILVSDLRTKIKEGKSYEPKEVSVPKQYAEQGTTLLLESVKPKRADLTATALRKRLARRFDVLDIRTADEGGFKILINDKQVTFADRQELKKLQFIWEFGAQALPEAALTSQPERFVLPNVVNAAEGWTISGWFGTTSTPTDLTDDEEAGSLKNIIVLARKRPIQEGIIEKLDFSKIFGNYVTGQIEAEFLDLDDREDIATSDRQRLIEDDDRVRALQKFLRNCFNDAAETWTEARRKAGGKDALDKYPKLKKWVDERDAYQRESARKMIGTIASLTFERKDEASRSSLFRSGVLAFERVGLRKTVDDLEKLGDLKAEDMLPLLARQEDYEAGLWVDILRTRVEAISKFQDLTSANEKEKVLQEHLFKNLWLLDASWERATEDTHIEESVANIDPTLVPLDRGGKKVTGRIDIRYSTHAGRHVVVELKRFAIKADIDDLRVQGGKYVAALTSVLEQQGVTRPKIEVVFVLGQPPVVKANHSMAGGNEQYIETVESTIGARHVYYNELIKNALNQYDDYLKASDRARELDELLDSIGNPESSPAKKAAKKPTNRAVAKKVPKT